MRKEAIYYYTHGYNCSQCILKAAEAYYRKPVPKDGIEMCRGINMGFGIGGMCSVLIAGVMVFGLFFDEITVKRLRLELLDRCACMYPSLNCPVLRKEAKNGTCEKLIGKIAGLISEIIDREMCCDKIR